MTTNQRKTANELIAKGFKVSTGPAGVLASRGNDCRIVHRDGSMRRARGAKR
ncbi:hypothetical protein KLEP174_gp75 [Pseudomonas phage vB_PcuM_ KLEP17-4]|nr:hypothetical protein KLEP174_gp75 [Pseudomonas phage vB_PcuM_ KLEP17-4]